MKLMTGPHISPSIGQTVTETEADSFMCNIQENRITTVISLEYQWEERSKGRECT